MLTRLFRLTAVGLALAVAPLAAGIDGQTPRRQAWHLTDLHGPRLTNSPGMHAAAAWTVERLTSWGLSGVRREPWGTFGRGWTNDRFTAHVVAPQPFPLYA